MSDLSAPSAEHLIEEAALLRPVSAGALMKKAREEAGLHIGALAVALKVPVKRLEALEADRWELLPDAVFARALASSVCRTLKIDPAVVLQHLPKTSASVLVSHGQGINTPLSTPSFVKGIRVFDQLSKPVVWVTLALLVGALGLIFLPSIESSPSSVAESPQELVISPGASMASMTSLITTDTLTVTERDNSAAPPAQGDATPEGLLVFKSRAPAWVEVTDGRGRSQLRREIVPGETVGVSGALPLSVVVGRADAVEVQLRGAAFNLETVSKANVARFEVKE